MVRKLHQGLNIHTRASNQFWSKGGVQTCSWSYFDLFQDFIHCFFTPATPQENQICEKNNQEIKSICEKNKRPKHQINLWKEQRPRGHICEKKKDHEIKSMRRRKTSVSCSLIVDFGVSTSAIIFMKQVLGD